MGDTTAVETDTTVSDNETLLTGSEEGVDTSTEDTTTETDEVSEGGDAGEEGSNEQTGTYADFTLPEGMTLNETVLSEATPIFKELGLNQEQAQKLIDIYAGQIQAGSQKQVDDFNQLMSDWRAQSEKDPEFGGNNFEANIAIARKAIDVYGTPGLKQLLGDHGVGNHPEVIRFMVKIGKTLKEDEPGSSGSASPPAQDRASLLYPNDRK